MPVLNPGVVQMLRIPESVIDGVAAREQRELERRAGAYRGDRAEPEIRGRTVLLVDDGLAPAPGAGEPRRVRLSRAAAAVKAHRPGTYRVNRYALDDVDAGGDDEPG